MKNPNSSDILVVLPISTVTLSSSGAGPQRFDGSYLKKMR
jgi:hypothetical protein